MKILAQKLKDGSVEVVEAPDPLMAPGFVRVRTLFSCISPGTEGNKIVTGKKSLIGKARAKPDQAMQVLDMARQIGLRGTLEKVRAKLEGGQPLGYSLAGIVEAVGEGVSGLEPGDLVACAGGGYANHADTVVVPVNLTVKVPEGVPAAAAATATLGAIALQGQRLAAPTLGESVVVVGLGVIGLLSCQLLKANGCRVFAADISGEAVDRARVAAGADAGGVIGADPVESQIDEFTRGRGADVVLICAATASDDPVRMAGRVARKRGRVVVVGAVGMDLPRTDYYEKELAFSVSCSYGPGRYDPRYEEGGVDYPAGFVRWTEGRNIEAVLDMMAAGRCDPLALVTHRLPFAEAPRAYEMIAARSESFGGILLEYPDVRAETPDLLALGTAKPGREGDLGLGFIGAGNFAQTFLLPPLKSAAGCRFTSILTRDGLGAADVGRRYGFARAVADPAGVIADPETDAVFVATRHDQHGPLTLEALRAGKHVYVEKPLCLTRDDLAAIARTLREAGAAGGAPVLQVGFNRRFSPAAGIVRRHFGRDHGPLSMIYRVSAGAIPREHWIQDPVEGGGRIMGEVCHFIDTMQFVCGADPVAVSAMCVATDNGAAVAEDDVLITLRFADGSIGSVGYFAGGAKNMPKERLEVLGDGRSAVLDNFQRVELLSGRSRRVRRCTGKGHSQEVAAFLDGVRSGRAPIAAESLLATTLATLQARVALAGGRTEPVRVADLFAEP